MIMDNEKLYKEALEKAREYKKRGYMMINAVLDNIFPELKESEDERIRKEIINFINRVYERQALIITDEEKDNWIAWLEKQGGQRKISHEEICKSYGISEIGEFSDGFHTFNELYYYRMLYNAAFFNMLPKEWVHKSKKHNDGEECFGGGWFIVMANLPTGQISNHYELKDWDLFQIPEKERADKWDGHTPQEAAERLHKYLLEKQGEKEISAPNWCHHKVDLSDYSEEYRKAYYDGWNNCNMQHSQCNEERNDVVKCLINGMKFYYEDNEDATWGTDKWSMPVKHIIEVLEKQGEHKSVDKVEPKFQNGQWVVWQNKCYKVNYNGCGYELIDQNGLTTSCEYGTIDENAHLWTIDDAKTGDVLAIKDVVFIFKHVYETGLSLCRSYCEVIGNSELGFGFDFSINNRVYPATKEQSDLLFSKMKENGCEWDAENKVLKMYVTLQCKNKVN